MAIHGTQKLPKLNFHRKYETHNASQLEPCPNFQCRRNSKTSVSFFNRLLIESCIKIKQKKTTSGAMTSPTVTWPQQPIIVDCMQVPEWCPSVFDARRNGSPVHRYSLQGGAKNGVTLSHCKYSEKSMTELRGNWWTSAILYAAHSH